VKVANSFDYKEAYSLLHETTITLNMADEDEIAALVIDNGSGMCKGTENPPAPRVKSWADRNSFEGGNNAVLDSSSR